jgi:hypothetical protein
MVIYGIPGDVKGFAEGELSSTLAIWLLSCGVAE